MKAAPSGRLDAKDLVIRFAVGGTAVVLCHLVSKVSPWRTFGGMFAAFPAVMAAAVAMSGARGGSYHASDVACGAVSGMLAGTVCVATCLALVSAFGSWKTAFGLGLVAWFVSAAVFASTVSPWLAKGRATKARGAGDEVQPRE